MRTQPRAMALTTLDGRAFGKFVVAGTYFLRKYRAVLNDLNVFPVPDGDTGSNLYLTARAALAATAGRRTRPLADVAAALAEGALLGARGNSGVILSQMLRGFAHAVRHRRELDALQLAVALKEAVEAARSALGTPVEGTIVTVAQAAADEAYRLARKETDLFRLLTGVVRVANAALERTPEQLPALKEAGVVDAGGAGFAYFMEGALRFLPPGAAARATAFPRRPERATVFTRRQTVGENRFCTEFVLAGATLAAPALRALLQPYGDSLIVAGAEPTLKVHLHTGRPEAVQAAAAPHGSLTRLKVEDMARQHRLLVVDAPPSGFGVVAVVPGPGFAQIARELGADETVLMPAGANPSVAELLVGINATLTQRVLLLANDPNVALAAAEAGALTQKDLTVVPTRDVVRGLAVLLALTERDAVPNAEALAAAAQPVSAAAVFFAGKDGSVGGVAVRPGAAAATIAGRLLTAPSLGEVLRETVTVLAAGTSGLATFYYGGKQTERDARRAAAETAAYVPGVDVEYYYGGQPDIEYWVSFER
jgi:DAK2 domain fusion protein YloV